MVICGLKWLLFFAACSVTRAQTYYPEISVTGCVSAYATTGCKLTLGVSADEAYVDAGASCYNPLEGKKEKVDVIVSGDTVELTTPGTYTVKYSCKNSDGLKASPKSRTVVIDPKYAEDWWEGEANIQIGGYTAKTFGALERKEFVKSLATSLDIPVSTVSLTSVSDGTKKVNALLKVKMSVDVAFKLKVMQETLINEVVNRMQDEQFDNNLQAEMKKNGISVADNGEALAVDKKVSVKNVLRKTLVAGLSGGVILAVVFLGIGAVKLNRLAKEAAQRGEYSTIEAGTQSEKGDLSYGS